MIFFLFKIENHVSYLHIYVAVVNLFIYFHSIDTKGKFDKYFIYILVKSRLHEEFVETTNMQVIDSYRKILCNVYA